MKQELLNKYIKGNATKEEEAEVVRWMEMDSRNMKEFLALRKLYDISIWQEDSFSTIRNSKRRQWPVRRILFEFTKIAAVFVLAFFLLKTVSVEEKKDVKMQTIYVPSGQRANLTLSDGTNVSLNANTTFTFPSDFSSDTREVTLNGEGYFNVKKDTEHPFIVKTQKYDVKVLGTEFNLMAYDDKSFFETSLICGSVEVYSAKTEETVTLEPNTRVSLVGNKLQKKEILDFNHFLWTSGIISFNDTAVQDMLNMLELYYDVKIIQNNKNLMTKKYTGKFRTKDGIEHVLKVLKLSNSFTYKKDEESNTIVIN